jgi:hypothetical protein
MTSATTGSQAAPPAPRMRRPSGARIRSARLGLDMCQAALATMEDAEASYLAARYGGGFRLFR